METDAVLVNVTVANETTTCQKEIGTGLTRTRTLGLGMTQIGLLQVAQLQTTILEPSVFQ